MNAELGGPLHSTLDPLMSRCLAGPFGLGLVTGPADSSRSTTVSAILSHLADAWTTQLFALEPPPDSEAAVGRSRKQWLSLDGTRSPGTAHVAADDPRCLVYAGEIASKTRLEECLVLSAGSSVIATLPTTSVTESLQFVVDLGGGPPSAERLAERVGWVLSQKPVAAARGAQRVAAFEWLPLLDTTAAPLRALVRDASFSRLRREMQLTSEKYPPLTMETSLAVLYLQQEISWPAALAVCNDAEELTSRVQHGLVGGVVSGESTLEAALEVSPEPEALKDLVERWTAPPPPRRAG